MSSDFLDRAELDEIRSRRRARTGPVPLRMLLIEDDEVDRMAFERFVRRQRLPYEVTTVGSAGEAKERLGQDTFDVVLTDYHLGDGTGVELLELDLDVPVIVITGAGDEEIAVRAMRAGAYDYLVKDIDRRYLKMLTVTIDKACRRHAAEMEIRMLSQALTSINDSIYVTDMEGRFTAVNDSFCRTYGYRESDVLGVGHDILWAEGAEQGLEPGGLAEMAAEGEKGECWHRKSDGSQLPVLLSRSPIIDSRDRRRAVVAAVRDITDRKQTEALLTHAALHDGLTGLPNRALFMDRLDNAIKRFRRRPDNHFGVVFLDLDRFKVINDSLGHLAGDKLLRAIARRLESCLRAGDTVARLGGDEFAILLADIADVSEVDRVADRIDQELEKPFNIQGHEFFSGASLGIALSSTGYERPEDILRDADTAMYRAKSEGRTRRVVFDPAMHERAMSRLHLENDLRRAVDRQEFLVYFQPLVALASGRLVGFEALLRWRHPERGVLSPTKFLRVAQETGLSPKIGWWVLGEATRRLKVWQERFPWTRELAISVNLDAKQLSTGELIERVESELAATDLEPHCLRLEITEAMIIENPELTLALLSRLRGQGIQLHVDDFGTGYSSLSQLHRYPVDLLKIDRSFVARMGSSEKDLEIVRTIIMLAHNMQLEVMGEGVETSEQLKQLRRLGCEYAQGYFFAKPLSPGAVEDLLEHGAEPFGGFGDGGAGPEATRTG